MRNPRLAAALALLAVASSSPADAARAPAVVVGVALQFVPGDEDEPHMPLVIERGTRLFFAGADPVGGTHTVTAYDIDTAGKPLFMSEQAGTGQVEEVRGTAALDPGRYRFYCGNHYGMDGVLTVTG